MGRRNPLTDWVHFFLGERCPWHYHACQIWRRSLKGFRGSCGSNFSISHWLCWSSLQHPHTTVWASDTWQRRRPSITALRRMHFRRSNFVMHCWRNFAPEFKGELFSVLGKIIGLQALPLKIKAISVSCIYTTPHYINFVTFVRKSHSRLTALFW